MKDDELTIKANAGARANAVDPQTILKTALEISHMRVPAQRLAQLLQELASAIRPGVSTAELARVCTDRLKTLDLTPIQRGYRGFPADVSISVNEVAAHGVPDGRTLHSGDVVTVDLSVDHGGWKADAAWSYAVGEGNAAAHRLLRAARAATDAGISAARVGARFGEIGAAVEQAAAQHGCAVARGLCGHGIGRSLHEAPRVFNGRSAASATSAASAASAGSGAGARIEPGMVFTVEPVVVLDTAEVTIVRTPDGYGLRTEDLRPCAQFEQTVAIFPDRTEVLTAPLTSPRRGR